MPRRTSLNLDVDLQRGVVPISKAASSLAALIKRASSTGQPVIVTQKGYPTGVLLPIEMFTALKDIAIDQSDLEAASALSLADESSTALEDNVVADNIHEAAPHEEPVVSKSRGTVTRRRKRIAPEPVDVGA